MAIVCGGLALAANGGAATYDVIHSSADTVTLLDPSAVEAGLGDHIRRARSISVQRNLVSGGPQQPGYVITQNAYDCTQWAIRWTGFSVYSRFGDVVLHKDNPDPAWTPIDNKNFEAAAGFRVVCDGRGVGRVYSADTLGHLVLALMQAWDIEAVLPPVQPVAAPPPIKKAARRGTGKPHDKAAKPR